jgi:uncharacterized protein DUF1996
VRVLAASLVAVAAAASAASASRLHGQNFFSNCYFSHIARDDPIVYPNQPGVSHSHTFFGSKSTNAASTAKELRASPTTCRRKADTGAYWVPTLYADGVPVKPTKGSAYFVLRARGAMRAFPPGLKIVAGDPYARSPQSPAVTFWSCSMLEGTSWTRPHLCTTQRNRRAPRFVQMNDRKSRSSSWTSSSRTAGTAAASTRRITAAIWRTAATGRVRGRTP